MACQPEDGVAQVLVCSVCKKSGLLKGFFWQNEYQRSALRAEGESSIEICSFWDIMNQYNTGKQGIGITVVTGFLGSGKSHFIRQLLSRPDAGQIAVIVNEIGKIGLDHLIYRHLSSQVALLEGGCLCCQLNGDLSQTLRELFMLAMQKKIPAFRHVIIETSGLADPSSIVFTLKHDFFLKERFYNAGVLCVVDCCHAGQQQQDNPEWLSQLVAADVVLLSKDDLCPENVPALKSRIEAVALGVAVMNKSDIEEVEEFFCAFCCLATAGKAKTGFIWYALANRWPAGFKIIEAAGQSYGCGYYFHCF